jgi:hypothetical protein
MNIETSINRLNKILKSCLLIPFLVVSCSKEQDHRITFKVQVQSNNTDKPKVQLVFDFVSAHNEVILLDWTTLSVHDPCFEKDGLLTDRTDLKNLIDSLKCPQFVIENENRELKLFSDLQLFEGESVEVESEFLLEPHIDTLVIPSNKPIQVKSESIDINRFKIRESDSTVRLHYLFKPAEVQRLAGFKPLILTSNWFKLDSSQTLNH